MTSRLPCPAARRVTLLGVMLLLACSSDRPGGGGPIAPVTPMIRSVTVEAGPGPLVRTVVVELSSAAAVEIDYVAEGAPRLRIARPAGALHRIPATRLLPDATYDLEARVVAPGGAPGDRATATFTTPPLPDGLAAVDFRATGTPSIPLVLLELRVVPFFGMVVVDAQGRVVWFHPLTGPPQGMTRRGNGNFVFLDILDGILEVTPAGEVVARLDQRPPDSDFHHDVQATPEGTVLLLANETGPSAIGPVTGEQILEWTPESGALQQVWSAFDVLDPALDVGPRFETDDWLHANSIRFGPRGNLLVSLHFLDQVISLTPDLAGIEWRLGGPGSSFALDPEAVFSGQHTATEIATDRVLLFDNRFDPALGEFSRVLEIAIDQGDRTASVARTFVPPNGNWSPIISSAYRLDSGNVLAGWGAPTATPREVYETTPDGAVAWRLEIHGVHSFFRANPLESIGEERVVAP